MPAVRCRRAVIGASTLAVAVSVSALAGCSEKSEAASGNDLQVTATDTTCEVSKKDFAAGKVTVAIENKGSKVTEVYIFGSGDRVVSERENIGPGTKAELTAEVAAGDYEIACKPGMKGDGIRQKVTVKGKGGPAAKGDPRLTDAVADYRTYVDEQAEETVAQVQKFTAAIKAGDVDQAKSRYAASRVGWERTEPVAESFGDIDPKVDLREDGLESGQEWTGWHRLEKALWVTGKITAKDKTYADTLLRDLKEWEERVGEAELSPTSMANGAKELLDEVATGKITGEEDRYSHTDLSDFNANVEGAKKAYDLLRPVAAAHDEDLVPVLDREFGDMTKALTSYRKGQDFMSYDKVSEDQRKELSDAVNALAEPLSKLAAAVAA